jgi:hypothetical protein
MTFHYDDIREARSEGLASCKFKGICSDVDAIPYARILSNFSTACLSHHQSNLNVDSVLKEALK